MSDLTDDSLESLWLYVDENCVCDRDADVLAVIVELQSHRAMAKRLETWAGELEASGRNHYEMTQREIAAELRNRMRGA